MKEFLLPKKIIKAENVENAECLFIKKELQIGWDEKNLVSFSKADI